MIICPGCGADMQYDPAQGMLSCAYCRKLLSVEAYRKEKEKRRELSDLDQELIAREESCRSSRAGDFFEARQYICPQCGASILSTEETAVTFCAYCGASVLLEGRMSRGKRPEKIIPFSVTKEECIRAYRSYLRFSPLLPKEMKQADVLTRFCGIYEPYWIYRFTQQTPLFANVKAAGYNGKYTSGEFYPILVPKETVSFSIAFDASSLFYDRLSKAIMPFDDYECVAFDPSYLSGFYADNGDIGPDLYRHRVRILAEEEELRRINEYCGFNGETAVPGQKFPSDSFFCEVEKAMLPVWFLTGRIPRKKGGDQIFHVVVNGQTGRITAEFPIDYGRFVLLSLLLAVPVFLLLKKFSESGGLSIRMAAAAAAVCSLCISIWQFQEADQYAKGRADIQNKQAREIFHEDELRNITGKVGNFLNGLDVPFIGKVLFLPLMIFMFSEYLQEMLLPVFMNWAGKGALAILLYFILSGRKKGAAEKKAAFSQRLRKGLGFCWKPLVGLAAALLPGSAFYGFSLLFLLSTAGSAGMIIWSIADIVKRHNTVTTQNMPALDKKGKERER